MSMSEMYEYKQCKCGKDFVTDISTLGLNRSRCGICELEKRIEKTEDIVGIVHYIISKSNIDKKISVNKMCEDILKGIIPKATIEKGLEKVNLDSSYLFFNTSVLAKEIKMDLANHLEYDPNLYDLIIHLLNYVN